MDGISDEDVDVTEGAVEGVDEDVLLTGQTEQIAGATIRPLTP